MMPLRVPTPLPPMVVLPVIVIAPVKVEPVPFEKVMAPLPPTPVPATLKVSAKARVPLKFKSSVAPDEMMLAVIASPKPCTFVRLNVPAETVVAPLYVFVPAKVMVPLPTLVKPKVLAPSVITPLKVADPVPPIVVAEPSVMPGLMVDVPL